MYNNITNNNSIVRSQHDIIHSYFDNITLHIHVYHMVFQYNHHSVYKIIPPTFNMSFYK